MVRLPAKPWRAILDPPGAADSEGGRGDPPPLTISSCVPHPTQSAIPRCCLQPYRTHLSAGTSSELLIFAFEHLAETTTKEPNARAWPHPHVNESACRLYLEAALSLPSRCSVCTALRRQNACSPCLSGAGRGLPHHAPARAASTRPIPEYPPTVGSRSCQRVMLHPLDRAASAFPRLRSSLPCAAPCYRPYLATC